MWMSIKRQEVLKVDADEEGMGDDNVATKAREVKQRKLSGL